MIAASSPADRCARCGHPRSTHYAEPWSDHRGTKDGPCHYLGPDDGIACYERPEGQCPGFVGPDEGAAR